MLNATVICHFYNEEYLLQWWLPHHKEIFKHGIMIDYASTDRSVELIKQFCPDWEIVQSDNKEFDAPMVDAEVMVIESRVKGFKIALNVTEFFMPTDKTDVLLDTDKLKCYAIPMATMVDNQPEFEPNPLFSLVKQKRFGFWGYSGIKGDERFLHNHHNGNYHVGRHGLNIADIIKTHDAHIYWYGFSPYNSQFIKRKMQIRERIPQSNVEKNQGFQHQWIEEQMNEKRIEFLSKSGYL